MTTNVAYSCGCKNNIPLVTIATLMVFDHEQENTISSTQVNF